uniref:Uncharacterized protein n=1 Tax=viral metagenome TaxID=1070528 RepID=A0A6C0D7N2_9ZZZZ
MNLKRNMKTMKRKLRKLRARKFRNRKTVRNHGGNGSKAIISDEQTKVVDAYIKIIENYLTQQKNNRQIDLESVKYAMFKKKFEEIQPIIANYKSYYISKGGANGDGIPTATAATAAIATAPRGMQVDEFEKLENMVYFIIKDKATAKDLLFDADAAGFQIWINNLLMYLINDSPFEDEIRMKLLEGINKKPYIKVLHNKTNNDIFDVNVLLANLKSELLGKNNDKKIGKKIKETSIKMRGEVENVPEDGYQNAN